MAEYLLYATFAYVVGQIATSLLKKDPEQPLVEDKPGTTSTRGSYVPFVLGRRRIGPNIGWVGDRFTTTESGGSGGKGAGGGSVEQTIYFESAWHQLCVGPARKLRTLWVNGKVAWQASGGGITPESHPSGSTVNLNDHDGSFTIYWGHVDQPVDAHLAHSSRVGIPSRWPNVCWVRLNAFRLGGFAVWPLVEYEVEVHPFRDGEKHGVDYATLAPRLANSTDWFKNQHGVQLPWREILDVHAESPTWIKVADTDGSVTASFPADSRCRLRFQPDAHVNGDYLVDEAVWNSSEQIVTLSGTYTDAGGYDENITAWTLASSNTLPVLTRTGAQYPPMPPSYAVADRYILQSGNDLAVPGAVAYNMTGGGDLFSRGASRMTVWIHGLGLPGDPYNLGKPASDSVTIGFTGRSGAETNTHTAKFEADASGTIAITNTNGAVGTVVDDFGEWKLLQVEYVAGSGSDPSDESWERDLLILWETDSCLGVYANIDVSPNYDQNLVDDDDGTVSTGVAQITLKQVILDLKAQLGDIAPLVAGLGPAEGGNAAHYLHQLLFAPWPHGRGLDLEDFDINSLEEIGEAVGEAGDGYRTHCIGLDGQSCEGLVAAILEDLGIALSWDPTLGKYRFVLIRKESLASVPQIPAEAVLDPLPEIRTRHDARTATAISFGFPALGQEYRDDTVTFVDDGEALRRQVQVRSNVPIRTCTDGETAAQAGLRRAQVELAAPTAYKVSTAWEARNLYVGRAIRLTGLEHRGIPADQILRIAQIELDAKTSKVKLTVLTDVYGVVDVVQGGAAPASGPGAAWTPMVTGDTTEASAPEAPPDDQAVAVHELSAFLSPDSIGFMLARQRGSRAVVAADVHLSVDGATYRALGRQQVYAGGGTLLEDLGLTRWYLDEGPLFRDDTGDTRQFAESLSDEEWLAGRLVALVDGEVMFPGLLEALGGSLWRMRRVMRGRYEFGQSAHTAGARVFLFRADRTPIWRDMLLAPDRQVWVKAQPRAGTSRPLDQVSAVTTTIAGRSQTPLGPTNLRTAKLSPSYRTGEDVTLRWGYRSRYALRNGAGFGCQRFGDAMGLPPPVEGEFRLEIRDGTDALVRTVRTQATEYVYENADLIADLGAEEDFTVRLRQEWGSRYSAELELAVELV